MTTTLPNPSFAIADEVANRYSSEQLKRLLPLIEDHPDFVMGDPELFLAIRVVFGAKIRAAELN